MNVLLFCVGVNKVRQAMKDLNARLPVHLQMTKATGHSGRHTFASVSMNASGGDVFATSVGTGHRDPKSLQTYVKPSAELKMKAARSIGQATASSSKKRTADEAELDDTDSTDEENVR